MSFLQTSSDKRVGLAAVLSTMATVLLLTLALLSSPATAHEVQPSVVDITVSPDSAELRVEATVEPFIAGIDMDGLDDTNASDRSDENDRLRNLPPADLKAALRDAWPTLQSELGLRVDGQDVPLELGSVTVPEVGNPEVPRVTTFTATAQLPEGDAPVVLTWDSRLGGVAVRQQGLEQDGYTAYLASGGETAEIPRHVNS